MDSMELIQFARVPPPDREPDADRGRESVLALVEVDCARDEGCLDLAPPRSPDRLLVPVRDCRPTVWALVAEREADAFWALPGADAPRFVPEPDFTDGVVDDVPDAFRPLAGCLVPPFGGLAIVSSLRGRLWSGMARSRQPRQVAFCFGLPATCNLSLGGHRKAAQIPTQVTSRPCRLSKDVLSLAKMPGQHC
jgi:hypothetical protein